MSDGNGIVVLREPQPKTAGYDSTADRPANAGQCPKLRGPLPGTENTCGGTTENGTRSTARSCQRGARDPFP